MNGIDDSLENSLIDIGNRCNPSERVVIIMDVRNIVCHQNLEYTNTRIDYAKLKKDILNGREDVIAIAVDSTRSDSKVKDNNKLFHNELKKAGFRVILVEASNNKGKQDGADVMIAVQATKYVMLGKCDIVELITGDGDFTVLVQQLQELCVKVGVNSLFGNLSYSLKDHADSVHILDAHPLIRMRPKESMVI